jgi:hypothetical protein
VFFTAIPLQIAAVRTDTLQQLGYGGWAQSVFGFEHSLGTYIGAYIAPI